MKYTFYFDESFHDRVIKLNKSGVLNTMVPNALDSYIGVFWGCKKEKAEEIESLLYVFEEKYIKKFGLENNKELTDSPWTKLKTLSTKTRMMKLNLLINCGTN